jgi:hypothetical protein
MSYWWERRRREQAAAKAEPAPFGPSPQAALMGNIFRAVLGRPIVRQRSADIPVAGAGEDGAASAAGAAPPRVDGLDAGTGSSAFGDLSADPSDVLAGLIGEGRAERSRRVAERAEERRRRREGR